MKERNPLIDVLKGFTIILVLIGHACQWFSCDDRSQPLYTTIYAFHMHLFNVLAYTDLTYMICICYIFIFLNIKKHKNML